jgi:hypothetical protein
VAEAINLKGIAWGLDYALCSCDFVASLPFLTVMVLLRQQNHDRKEGEQNLNDQ